MRGRAKGNQERIIVLAHQTELFAREKRLKPISSYLRRLAPSVPQNAEVISMFERMAAKGKKVNITLVAAPGVHGN